MGRIGSWLVGAEGPSGTAGMVAAVVDRGGLDRKTPPARARASAARVRWIERRFMGLWA
jgi:hypothetical protein